MILFCSLLIQRHFWLELGPRKTLIPLKRNKYFQDVFILAFSLHKRKEEAAAMSDNNLSLAGSLNGKLLFLFAYNICCSFMQLL